jgi:hypothetical protein
MGACGAAKVRERFSLGAMAPRLYQVMESLLDPTAAQLAPTT